MVGEDNSISRYITDIGQFFIDQFDRVTEFIANVFGVSFEPYDGLISYISGKLQKDLKLLQIGLCRAGTFILEGVTGIRFYSR